VPPAPPRDQDELLARARALRGVTLDDLARDHGGLLTGDAVRTKGKVGELLERVLGATGGSSKVHDFPELRVELKSIPVDAVNKPRESTFVCALSVDDPDREEWATSWVRRKLARVLWIPIVTPRGPGDRRVARTIGEPLLWSPTREQDDILRADFDDVMGTIGIGGIEGLTAHMGRWLQARPKAAHGRVKTIAYGADGEAIATTPRGFYLRTKFTGAILQNETACPE
jgi:DNA mismatch repair protein MutH